MRELIVSSSILLFAAFNIYSQTGKLSGTVTGENKKPVQFVSVIIIDLGLSTSTNSKGYYEFEGIPSGKYVLTFKRNGYISQTREAVINGKDEMRDISLTESLIETPVIDVTSSFNPTDISKSTYSVTELSSRNITKMRSQTLAETIVNIPGINNISTGVSLGKPVIRGLSFQSVLIVHDGVKHESQLWGDEHGPELSIFDLERIEILRGPASLIYGADGIGGVVNVISKPLEFSSKLKPIIYGEAVLGGFSVNNQGFGNLTLGLGTKNVGLKGHFGYRKAGNTKTPEGTLNVQTLNGEREIQGGELQNSGSEEIEGGANLGYKATFGLINLGFETMNRELQLHDDPAQFPDATGSQSLNTNQFSLQSVFNINKTISLEPVLSYQMQQRREYESIRDKNSDDAALELKINTLDANIHLHHETAKNITGTFGMSFTNQINSSLGEEKLIPNYYANTFGIYLLEQLSIKYFTFSVGGRFDTKKLNVKETIFESDSLGNPQKILGQQDLSFNAVTGSLGFVYAPLKGVNIFSNIGRGWRPPSEFELYVDGVHEGTGRYDRGLVTQDSIYDPKSEESLNLDLGVRINYKNFSAQISAFRNRVNNFVYPSPTTDTLEGFPVYNIKQDKSTFIGYEYSLQFQPVSWILLLASGDYVKTKNEATSNPLPFTPAMKNIFELKLQKSHIGKFSNPYIKFAVKLVSSQDEVDPLETPTEGYTLLNAGIGFDFVLAKSVASVDFSVDNLANTKYTDHLSRYRAYAMNPGRSFNLQLSVPFRF